MLTGVLSGGGLLPPVKGSARTSGHEGSSPMRTCAAIVCVAAMAAGVARADDAPPIFESMEFAKAVEATKGNDSVLVVKFMAVWCGPCKLMDKSTWRDDSVEAWFKANGRAIQIDVDKEKAIARENKIRAMPTMVAFKGGAEFDRVVGFQNAEQMVAWAGGVKRGVKAAANEELKKSTPRGGESPMQERMGAARRLIDDERFDEATREYLWLWQNMVKKEPSMVGVRLSFLARDMKRLVAQHVPAKNEFGALRDSTEERLKGKDRSFEDRRDWMTLNELLGDEDKTLEWFDRIKGAEGIGQTLRQAGFRLQDLLRERRRWADLAITIPNLDAWLRGQ
jgi:thioredoxin 1